MNISQCRAQIQARTPVRLYVPLSVRVPAGSECLLGEAHRSVVPWNKEITLVPRSVRANADSYREPTLSSAGVPFTLAIPNGAFCS